jgi:hypothetical protein
MTANMTFTHCMLWVLAQTLCAGFVMSRTDVLWGFAVFCGLSLFVIGLDAIVIALHRGR